MYVRYPLIKYTPKFLGVLREYENMKEEREQCLCHPTTEHTVTWYLAVDCQ